MILPIVGSLACAIAVVMLVVAERDRDRAVRGRFLWKPIASGAFLIVPLVGGALGADAEDATVARWVIAGLCLGALGDLALMFETKRGFLGGLVAFLLGHVAYVVACTQIVAIGHWFGDAVPIATVLIVIAAAMILRWLWPNLGTLRAPVIAYLAVISTMLIGGVAISLRGDGATVDAATRGLVTAGAAVFYLSDLAVAREKFGERDGWNRTLGLPAYYGAQLLFAWAIIPR